MIVAGRETAAEVAVDGEGPPLRHSAESKDRKT